MGNESFDAALTYHEATKHSEISMGTSSHYLDWDNRPSQFKEYQNLPSISLPRDFPHPKENSAKAIAGQLNKKSDQVGIETLAEILFFSGGLTRKMRIGSDFHYMRAASATGALYPIELYVISGRIPGLDPGVYHFNPFLFSLVKLREGDYRTTLENAGSKNSSSAPFTIALTSIAWRNAWKYEARSYRHWFWDSGVIAANLLATANSAGFPARLELGFVDPAVDKLLVLQSKKEATVALAIIGEDQHLKSTSAPPPVRDFELEISPLSREEVDYTVIWETNEASQLKTKAEVESWRTSSPETQETLSGAPSFPLPKRSLDSVPTLDKVILQRGSTRRFAHQPISLDNLSTIMETSSTEIPLDFLAENQSLIDFYFIANDVQGLASGSYFYNRETSSLEQLKLVKSRSMSGYLSLGQQLFSDASVVFFLMTSLNQVLHSLGNRGYRAAQFEAGVRAGKIYLASYALGIGASGSTFFDDAVTEFFSPHARDKSCMITIGVGVPSYKARTGSVNPQFGSRIISTSSGSRG
jgi:SagB-type dehydrogenase family enzyme